MSGSAHDSIGRLQDLAAEARSTSARLASLTEASSRHEGRDATSVVRAVLDGGLQLVELELHESWRSRLGDDNLPDAVREAVRNAREAWSAALEERIETSGEAPPVEPDEPAVPRIDHVEFDIEQASAMIDHVLRTLPRLDEQLAQLWERADEVASSQPADTVTSGPREVISVALSPAGEITALDIDKRWLRGVPREMLAEELLATIQAAQQSGPVPDLTDGLDALEDLRALTADPQRLLQSFGFIV